MLLPLETEEAVGAVKDEGSFTGLVGDLGLGLINPVSLTSPVLIGAGFVCWPFCFVVELAAVVVAGFLTVVRSVFRAVVFVAGCLVVVAAGLVVVEALG